jgi:hypothetical protein
VLKKLSFLSKVKSFIRSLVPPCKALLGLYNNDKIYATEIYLTVLEMKFTAMPQYTLAYANFKY